MPYYVVAIEQPLPKTPQEFHQEFYTNYAMTNLAGEHSVVGTGFSSTRWKMLKGYVTRLKPGTVPPGARTLQGGYGLEAVDERHRMPDLLTAMRELYFKKTFPPTFHDKTSVFLRWVDDFCALFPDDVKAFLKKSINNLPAETYDTFVETGVTYKDNPYQRFSYLVMFHGGKMYQKGKLLSTRTMRTHFSKDGWAIFVISTSGLWYLGSHVVGKFQHSSFLGGRPVLSAGKIKVENGEPVLITAKSGHYTPTMDQFLAGLRSLNKLGVNMVQLNVLVKDNATNQRVQLSAATFMTNAALRGRHSVW